MISPEFWTDDKVIELSIQERLLFIGMWNFSDDEGLIANKPKQMKAQIFPVDDITHGAISEMLMRIHQVGLIQFGNDNTLIKIKNWTRHQKINRPTPSNYKFTKVITESSVSTQETLTPSIVEDSGKEDKGKEKNISPQPKKVSSKPLLSYPEKVEQFYKGLSKDQVYLEQLKEAYPNVDIPGQIKASKMWLLSNTHKAKKNFKRFVNTWMANQMEYNKSKPGNIVDVNREEERIEKERLAFAKKMEAAEKEAATDEDRMEALKDWRKNKRKIAHENDTKSNEQPLKGALDNVLKGFGNG
tara:strand:- start:8969 stop:9868 length:900 start_codon:yes stop_codon:yes gene_type:complete